ncbi:MAG: hypothetical protein CVV07_07205 [Gammaproteobacteria bacterium HGW-Gammaproteobacteria-11]|nr:MAG: hypothetical protein CVV07_07205 [Gammaproteobacteria bacterium HGW-Gammaproteobacteria-11]
MNTKDYRYLDTLPDSSMLSPDEVLALVRISRSTWYAGIKSGRYPPATHIGPASPRWRLGVIRDVMNGTYSRPEDQNQAA